MGMNRRKRNRQGGKSKQRMAGEVWRGYDAASQGGAGFDNKDLRYLVEQGWSNNDILKAAAAAGQVKPGADRQLRLLGTADSKFSPMKQGDYNRSALWEAAASGGIAGGLHGSKDHIDQRVRFLGGDPEKKKNWLVAQDSDDKGRHVEGYYGSIGGDSNLLWSKPGTRYSDKKGRQQDVLRWNGVDGDGRALGLTGVQVRGDDSKFGRQNRSVSWNLPQDFVAERDAADFARQMEAYKAANPEPERRDPPPRRAAPFDPSQFQSQVDDLMAAVGNLKTVGSDGGNSTPVEDDSTAVRPVEPVPPVGQNDNGDFLGGFESIINRRYGRPMDWMGDVWAR